jgi:hypothetical protein
LLRTTSFHSEVSGPRAILIWMSRKLYWQHDLGLLSDGDHM